jgi:hypothetical protein
MNKVVLVSLLVFIVQESFPQTIDNLNTGEGQRFLKRIENNFINNWAQINNGKEDGFYNFDSKTYLEKLFFGDCNAKVEFFINPSFESVYGFRIVRDSSDISYILEIKRISNWKEVEEKLAKEFPSKSFPVEQILSVSKEEIEQTSLHNGEIYKKRLKESLKLYRVNTQAFAVNSNFVEQLYKTIMEAIDNFAVKGTPAVAKDGYFATFRCVVKDEVWTLTIHLPEGDIKNLTNICKQIIEDIETNTFKESKYVELLDNIHEKE